MSLSGGCLCGQLRYEVAGEPVFTMVCHCRNCQKQSGSAFSFVIVVAEDALTCTGSIATYEDSTASSKIMRRQFCPTCGSAVFSRPPGTNGLIVIKAGTLDDASMLKPQMHIWTQSAQHWVDIPADLPHFYGNPEV